MKKFYKTFTFYFVVIGIIIVLLNISGNDDIMNSNTYFWHIASFITNTLYGLILDFIRVKIKRR